MNILNPTNAKMQGGGLGAGIGTGLGAAIAAAILGLFPDLTGTPWEDVVKLGCVLIVTVSGAALGAYIPYNQVTPEQVKVSIAKDPKLAKEIVKEAVPVDPAAVQKVIDDHKEKLAK